MRRYGLGIVLGLLFLASWVAQTWMGWEAFVAEQASHGEAATRSAYLREWGQATFENWQSEFLQVLAFVTLTSFLIFKGSPESRDGDDEMQAKLDRIERQLGELATLQRIDGVAGHVPVPIRIKTAGD